jgi:HTH-type transcriptional regulator/antitoxin MqsA
VRVERIGWARLAGPVAARGELIIVMSPAMRSTSPTLPPVAPVRAASVSRPICPVCRQGRLLPGTECRQFRPRGKPVQLELLSSVCDRCGQHTVRADQHSQNLQRLADRKHLPEYAGLLLGEEIVALRHRYGLTQLAAARIFGKGKVAFSRYENEVSFPDASTTLLLRLAIDKPECMKWLADLAGEPLPLWQERWHDRRGQAAAPADAGMTTTRAAISPDASSAANHAHPEKR